MVLKPVQKTSDKLLYRSLSLVQLIKRIVKAGDRQALEEFLNRTLFTYHGDRILVLTDYLNILRQVAEKMARPARNAVEIADKAYGLTLSKFVYLPHSSTWTPKNCSNGHKKMKRIGPDSRLYLNAFIKHIDGSFNKKPPKDQFEAETRAAWTMQGLVKRQFYYSMLEAKRSVDPFWTRYNWNFNGHTICVCFPVAIEGNKRRAWLKKNIEDPDPLRAGERQRVQATIDRMLVRELIVPINEAVTIPNDAENPIWDEPGVSFADSLANVVAEEKAINIKQQRRTIRALGKPKLKKLILQIFESISHDDYKDSIIAKNFSLSKATFSRFAGSRWPNTDSSVPDLWRNTAQVLKDHPIFRQVAKDTGFWDQVTTTVDRSAFCGRKPKSHE